MRGPLGAGVPSLYRCRVREETLEGVRIDRQQDRPRAGGQRDVVRIRVQRNLPVHDVSGLERPHKQGRAISAWHRLQRQRERPEISGGLENRGSGASGKAPSA